MDKELLALSRSLLVELSGSIGFRDSRFIQNMLWPIFKPVTNALARIGLVFDKNVQDFGFSRAMGLALEDFASKVYSRGAEKIPSSGPLLVVSNHPGTYDSLVVTSKANRDDLNFISGDIPFLKTLPTANNHFFCISEDITIRMIALRNAIRHIKSGGAMMLYGYGHIDPDPNVYPGAQECIDHWSPSIELLLKSNPQTCLVLSIVSHVVSLKWRNSILYHLRKDPLDRRRMVEFGQVIQQLLFPRSYLAKPMVSFSQPIGIQQLCREAGSDDILPAIISRAKVLLSDHIAWTKSFTPA
jgi:hypothetical protein